MSNLLDIGMLFQVYNGPAESFRWIIEDDPDLPGIFAIGYEEYNSETSTWVRIDSVRGLTLKVMWTLLGSAELYEQMRKKINEDQPR